MTPAEQMRERAAVLAASWPTRPRSDAETLLDVRADLATAIRALPLPEEAPPLDAADERIVDALALVAKRTASMETRRLKGERTVPLVDDVLEMLPHLTEDELRRVAEAISKALTHHSNEVVCDHGVTFDAKAARGLSVVEIRRRWPRGFGPCPKNCGWSGICYASEDHFIAGDW